MIPNKLNLIRSPSQNDIVPDECEFLIKFIRVGVIRVNIYNLMGRNDIFRIEALRIVARSAEGEDQRLDQLFREEEILCVIDLQREAYQWIRDNRGLIVSEIKKLREQQNTKHEAPSPLRFE